MEKQKRPEEFITDFTIQLKRDIRKLVVDARNLEHIYTSPKIDEVIAELALAVAVGLTDLIDYSMSYALIQYNKNDKKKPGTRRVKGKK